MLDMAGTDIEVRNRNCYLISWYWSCNRNDRPGTEVVKKCLCKFVTEILIMPGTEVVTEMHTKACTEVETEMLDMLILKL